MYICEKCGKIFQMPKIEIENIGECWGMPAYEECGCSPCCDSDEYSEAVLCEICGKWHSSEQMYGKVCDECVEKCKNDFETTYKIAKSQKIDVKLNSLIPYIFDEEDIEKILFDYVKNNFEKIDCSKFIEDDVDWFADRLWELKKS